jgi:hypothetical protein
LVAIIRQRLPGCKAGIAGCAIDNSNGNRLQEVGALLRRSVRSEELCVKAAPPELAISLWSFDSEIRKKSMLPRDAMIVANKHP